MLTRWGSNKRLWIAITIALLALLLRLPGLGDFMTVDETNWMLRSATFYDKLLAGDPGGTFLTTHPGSTVMWLIGGGETIQEQRLGFEVHSSNLLHFRKAAVFPIVLVIAMLIGLTVWLLAPLFGLGMATVAGVLLAADTYFVGHSQVAHLDALQAMLMLTSFLAFLEGAQHKQFKVHSLLLAGILAGLAMGVKLILAAWLLPMFVLALVVKAWPRPWQHWRLFIRRLGFVIGVAVLVFWLLWPALWVKDDVARSLTRDYTSVVTDEHISFAAASPAITPQSFYVRTWLGRLSPQVQLLSLGAVVLLIAARKQRRTLALLVVYALGFLMVITLAAKKADRYAWPALIVFQLLAAWGAVHAWRLIKRWQPHWSTGLAVIAGLLVVTLPFLHAYPISYNNPLFPNVRSLSQQGWGEGLDAAARWLNEHPLGDNLYVASWYPSVMRTYFSGKTFSLSSREDYRVGYIVTYRNMGGREPDAQASNVLDEVKGKEPVHTITIKGVPYINIYETLSVGNFTKHVGEVVAGVEVGQTFTVDRDSFDTIEIGFATFSSRNNTQDVVLRVYDSPAKETLLRSATVNARDIVDNEWQPFTFEPLTDQAEQELYLAVTSPTSRAGDAVTVRYIDEDIKSGEMHLQRPGGSLGVKPGDIAYQLPE